MPCWLPWCVSPREDCGSGHHDEMPCLDTIDVQNGPSAWAKCSWELMFEPCLTHVAPWRWLCKSINKMMECNVQIPTQKLAKHECQTQLQTHMSNERLTNILLHVSVRVVRLRSASLVDGWNQPVFQHAVQTALITVLRKVPLHSSHIVQMCDISSTASCIEVFVDSDEEPGTLLATSGSTRRLAWRHKLWCSLPLKKLASGSSVSPSSPPHFPHSSSLG